MRVLDVRPSDLPTVYDLGIFASGFEKRSTTAHRTFVNRGVTFRRTLVFGFTSHRDDAGRIENDKYFIKIGSEPICIGNSAANDVFDVLAEYRETLGANPSVFVDYSAMSRTWYSAIAFYFFKSAIFTAPSVDLCYSCGQYDGSFGPLAIRQVAAIFGCDGANDPGRPLAVVISLGFDCMGAQCVLDQLEPDIVFPIVAGGNAANDSRAERANEDLIKDLGVALIRLPLRSVEHTYGALVDLLVPVRGNHNVALVPMGPKTHTLASVLMSLNFNDVACLHVSGERNPPINARPTDELIITRIFNEAVGQ